MASTSYSLLDFPTQRTLHATQKTQTFFISFIEWIKKAWKETLTDFSTRWPLFSLSLWLTGLFLSLIALTVFLSPPSTACRPDDTFSPYDGYSYWDASGFFQITFAFGSFSFTEVKLIDTAWDIVIGRVGQGILAYFSWHSFADYATVSMETTPITYTTFIILFLESDPSFKSICQLLRDFLQHRRLSSKVSTAWVIISMLFVLAWPTLISAMSGYSPETGAYVQDINGNFVPYNEFRLLSYVIHDGSRINLTDDYHIPLAPRQGDGSDNILLFDDGYYPDVLGSTFDEIDCGSLLLDDYGSDDMNFCYLQANVSDYVQKYGFSSQNKNASHWLGHTLPGSSLDIEPFLVPQRVLSTMNITRAFQPSWVYENHTYTLQDIRINGACKTIGASFQWGFSYLQLFTVVLSLALWTIGTYLLRYQTHQFLLIGGHPERPRGLRALLLLAQIVKIELEASGINPHTQTNQQLKQHIYKNLKGGSTSFGFPLRRKDTHRRSVLQWLKEDLWWLVVTSGFPVILFLFSGGILAPLCLAIFSLYLIGTTTKSKIFLTVIILLLIVFSLITGYYGRR
ncbi:hypothetical protein F5Y03DRAFT_378179 [Xylaria venustula]|nr:hypothetical protein F5Y03DRAFT_378179 [Xylaria venustula]